MSQTLAPPQESATPMTGLLPEGAKMSLQKPGSEVFGVFFSPSGGETSFTPFRLFPIAVFYFLLPSLT